MMNRTAQPPWAVTPKKVQEAVRRIAELVRPRRIILFGAYVRGETHLNSDVDLLVVVRGTVDHPRKASVQLQKALRHILMPLDILVVPESQWEAMKDTPGLILEEAWRHGRVVYES